MLDEVGRLLGLGFGRYFFKDHNGKKYSRMAVNAAPKIIKISQFLGSRGPYPWLRRVQVNDALQILHILHDYNGSLVGKLRASSYYGNSSLGNSSTPYVVLRW